jgi:hypothetical protein
VVHESPAIRRVLLSPLRDSLRLEVITMAKVTRLVLRLLSLELLL